jgi:hypothetical protein
MFFSAEERPFFSRALLEPYVVIRPLARPLTGTNDRWGRLERLVQVKLSGFLFLQEFSQEDFGAIGGLPRTGREWIPTVSFIVDIGTLIGW